MNTSFIPIVSIVIPTYNHAKFISKALKSVIDQTYKNWEAIIIDNESIDETYKLINNFNDQRIKYFKIANDGVIAKSRNLGINEAKGEWIAFLDSDDWWTKDKLEVQTQEPTKFVSGVQERLENLPLLDAPPMTIAVYSFVDKTGQRKPSERFSQLSTAVTQGADSWVIDALQNAGKGEFHGNIQVVRSIWKKRKT